MSQSDYLKYKRISTELKINKLDPIFHPNDYLSYKEFSLENSIINEKINYNQLILPNKNMVFNMEKNICPLTFNTCKNTDVRTNRKPLLKSQITPSPLQPLYVKQKTNKVMNFCDCGYTKTK